MNGLLKEPWTAIWPAFWVRSHADYPMALDRLSDAVDRADEKLVLPAHTPIHAGGVCRVGNERRGR
jgi:hypothetical protein